MSTLQEDNALDRYRRKASFSVPALKNYLFEEELVVFEQQVCQGARLIERAAIVHMHSAIQIWDTLERDPLFAHQDMDLTLDQKRELTHKRAKRLVEYDFIPDIEPTKERVLIGAIQMYDLSVLLCMNLSRRVSELCKEFI